MIYKGYRLVAESATAFPHTARMYAIASAVKLERMLIGLIPKHTRY